MFQRMEIVGGELAVEDDDEERQKREGKRATMWVVRSCGGQPTQV
jgi:hypothetical protein